MSPGDSLSGVFSIFPGFKFLSMNERSDAISNTLNRQPEKPATKWLS